MKIDLFLLFLFFCIQTFAQKQPIVLDNQEKISIEERYFFTEKIEKVMAKKITFTAFVDGCGKANEIPVSNINHFIKKLKISSIGTSYYLHQGKNKFYLRTDHFQQKYGNGFPNSVKIIATLYEIFAKTGNHHLIIINKILLLTK